MDNKYAKQLTIELCNHIPQLLSVKDVANYTSLSRLINELNRTLGITSDTERENLIQSYYNNHGPNHEYYLYIVGKYNLK